MKINLIIKKTVPVLLAFIGLMLVAAPGHAAMVGTAQLQQDQNYLLVDLQAITEQREWIREQLVVGGVNETDAGLRVAGMTDLQVQQIYQRIDEAPAGGNTFVILILVLVITELMGYTDIVPNWPANN